MMQQNSPHGGSVKERRSLEYRFGDRISVNPRFSRKTVSYQGNHDVPGLRWMKFKEGFSKNLVDTIIREFRPNIMLDPFSGIGTTALVASGHDIQATGIEIMPVGTLVSKAIALASNGLSKIEFENAGYMLINAVTSNAPAPAKYSFPHVQITQSAFTLETEAAIAKARAFIDSVENADVRSLLNVACMTVLEATSYTRKDGQYLRWDYRSGRSLKSRVDKGPIAPFAQALDNRLSEMLQDIDSLRAEFGGKYPEFLTGSSLDLLAELPASSVDLVITSPPYANRYDYTRTYALELAWLGYTRNEFSNLRQNMITATVENKSKREWLRSRYKDNSYILDKAYDAYQRQGAIREILDILTNHMSELGNRHVIRLIEGYFLEMSVVIAELGRVVRAGGSVIMVNDNVQYHGEEVPVDLILADFAEQSGFECNAIWALPRGKGNSSQQMRRFGRREIRKCVYKWTRTND